MEDHPDHRFCRIAVERREHLGTPLFWIRVDRPRKFFRGAADVDRCSPDLRCQNATRRYPCSPFLHCRAASPDASSQGAGAHAVALSFL